MSKNEDKGPMRALHSAHLPNNAIPEVFQDLPGDLMNLSWAAAYTGLSIADLHRMAREGRFPEVHGWAQESLMVSQAAFKEWVESKAISPSASSAAKVKGYRREGPSAS